MLQSILFQRSLVTATKTRKKQQTELIKMALQAQDDKKREEREKFLITTIPITIQAAHEPSLHHVGEEHEQEGTTYSFFSKIGLQRSIKFSKLWWSLLLGLSCSVLYTDVINEKLESIIFNLKRI